MKKTYIFAAATAGALMLSACGGNEASEGETAAAAEETTEVAAVEECTEDSMMAKATELGEKMQGLADDPEAMQAMVAQMQEVQESITAGAADGSFGIAEACTAYDEMLAAG